MYFFFIDIEGRGKSSYFYFLVPCIMGGKKRKQGILIARMWATSLPELWEMNHQMIVIGRIHLTKPKQNASPLPSPNRFPFVNVITVSSQLRPKPRVVLDFCHHLLLCNIQPISGFFLFHLRMTSILTVHFDHPRPNHHWLWPGLLQLPLKFSPLYNTFSIWPTHWFFFNVNRIPSHSWRMLSGDHHVILVI